MNESPSNRVAGADAARIGSLKGWAVAVLAEGRLDEVTFIRDLRPLVESLRLVAVDIPIGLPGDNGVRCDGRDRRRADREARDRIGARRNSVFWAPPQIALDQPTYAQARQQCPWLSSQAYSLRERIGEVALLVARGARLIEFHPELSFQSLQRRPLDYPKKSWNGQGQRRRILHEVGIELPGEFEGDVGLVPADDILDAVVGAMTAQAVIQGRGTPVGGGENADWQDRGVIWCP